MWEKATCQIPQWTAHRIERKLWPTQGCCPYWERSALTLRRMSFRPVAGSTIWKQTRRLTFDECEPNGNCRRNWVKRSNAPHFLFNSNKRGRKNNSRRRAEVQTAVFFREKLGVVQVELGSFGQRVFHVLLELRDRSAHVAHGFGKHEFKQLRVTQDKHLQLEKWAL